MDKKNIVIRIRNGDKEAFEEAYWQYSDTLHRLALRFLKDDQLAEDAVQDLFINLWNDRKKLDQEKSLKAFLFVSLKNHVLNMIKKNKRRIIRQFEYVNINEGTPEKTDDAIIQSDYRFIYNRGLKQLPVVKRQIYELKMGNNFSNDEIAARLGLSVNTVKSHYYLAKKSMRDFFSSYNNFP
ncbi:MAG: RNA polymerase sigma-70 factor [Balneolaceae bacterium]